MTEPASLMERVAALEAREAIRALKHRYFRACDGKDPEGMKQCFAVRGAHIAYDRIGSFDSRADLVAVYTAAACRDTLQEMHHGHHADIEVLGDGRARGRWDIFYMAIDRAAGTVTQAAGSYQDEYVVEDGYWKIGSTTFTTSALLVQSLGGELPDQAGPARAVQ